MNLSICANEKVNIYIPVNISINKIDKFNKSSDMYNDLCYTLTSENGTDKPLKDRQSEFVDNNLSICEEDCTFTEYDIDTKMASCSCPTKIKLPLISEIKIDKKKLASNFKDVKNIGNFNILKCIYLLFKADNILKNSSNYMALILLVLSLISKFVYCFRDKKKIKDYIKINHNQINNNKDDKSKDTNKALVINKNKKKI